MPKQEMQQPRQRSEKKQGKLKTFRLRAGQHIGRDYRSEPDDNGEYPYKTFSSGAKVYSYDDLAAKHGREKFERIDGPGDEQETLPGHLVGVAPQQLAFPHGQVHDGFQETVGNEQSHPLDADDHATRMKEEGDDEEESPEPKQGRNQDRAALEDMTVSELKEYAAAEEIDISGITKKDDIIDTILEAKK